MSVSNVTITTFADLAGPHDGTERLEQWVKDALTNVWAKEYDEVIGGLASVVHIFTGKLPGVQYVVAGRVMRDGAAQVGSRASDPAAWPAGQRATVVTLLDNPSLTGDPPFAGAAIGSPLARHLYFDLLRTLSDTEQSYLGYEVEVFNGAAYVPWDAVTIDGTPTNIIPADNSGWLHYAADRVSVTVSVTPYAGQSVSLRVRRRTPWRNSTWLNLAPVAVPA